MSGIRVVVVDDHPIVREGVRSLVDREPDISVVGEAADGNAAIHAVREADPDVVVMDVTMSALNGVEATRRITVDLPRVNVLCFSMFADGNLVTASLDAGASGYILKDAAPAELVTAIRAVAADQMYMSTEVAGYALGDRVANGNSEQTDRPRLTRREHDVLQLIAEGCTTAEIATRLSISTKTVGTHREHIMKKLDLHNVVALAKWAIRHGISTVDPDLS